MFQKFIINSKKFYSSQYIYYPMKKFIQKYKPSNICLQYQKMDSMEETSLDEEGDVGFIDEVLTLIEPFVTKLSFVNQHTSMDTSMEQVLVRWRRRNKEYSFNNLVKIDGHLSLQTIHNWLGSNLERMKQLQLDLAHEDYKYPVTLNALVKLSIGGNVKVVKTIVSQNKNTLKSVDLIQFTSNPTYSEILDVIE
jgi:hypothetical protein